MKIYIFIIYIFITSCGKYEIPHEINIYFISFLDHFKRDADEHFVQYGDIKNITVIKFGNIKKENTIAKCSFIYEKDKFGKVFFYKEMIFLESFKEKQLTLQYQIFLHEIGHCAYHLSHNPDPFSIMAISSRSLPISLFQEKLNEFFIDAKLNENNWNSFLPI